MKHPSPSSPEDPRSRESNPSELLRQAAHELGGLRKASDLATFLQCRVPDPAAWRRELTGIWSETFGNPAAGTSDWDTYVQGIAELGPAAAHLIPSVVKGACQPTTGVGMTWSGFIATIAAGDRSSVKRVAPVALARRRVATISLAEGATHTLCDKLRDRLSEHPHDRPWLGAVISRSTAEGAYDAPQRNLCADVILAFLGDDHPNAQAYIRGLATGVHADGARVGRPSQVRADRVLSWCGHQVDQGRQQLLTGDQALMGSLMHLACTGTMPGASAAAVTHQQSVAAALLGRISGGPHAS
jgi:hypothetical protein